MIVLVKFRVDWGDQLNELWLIDRLKHDWLIDETLIEIAVINSNYWANVILLILN